MEKSFREKLTAALAHLFRGGWMNDLLCGGYGAALILLGVVHDRLGWLAFLVFAAAVVVLTVFLVKDNHGSLPAGQGWAAVGVWAAAVYRVRLQPGYLALITFLSLGLVAVMVYNRWGKEAPEEAGAAQEPEVPEAPEAPEASEAQAVPAGEEPELPQTPEAPQAPAEEGRADDTEEQ